MEAQSVVIERRLNTPSPWPSWRDINFHEIGPEGKRDARGSFRRATAEERLRKLPTADTWVWSDGSTEADASRSGGGAAMVLTSSETREVGVPDELLCSTTTVELIALHAALDLVVGFLELLNEGPVVAFLDSQAAFLALEEVAPSQRSPK